MTKLLSSVQLKGKPKRRSPEKGSLTIDIETALLVRRVCRHDGMLLTPFVDAMLRAYLRVHHSDWKLTEVVTEPHEHVGRRDPEKSR